MLHDDALIGAVGIGRKQHDRDRAGLARLLGPATRLLRAVRRDAGDDDATGSLSRRDRGLHDLGALLVGEGLVLPE